MSRKSKAARERALNSVGPPPKKPGWKYRLLYGKFDYENEVRQYENRLYDRTLIERKSAKSGCLSAILPPLILASRLFPWLPELKLPEAPAETTKLAQIISEAGSLTVAVSTAEPVVDLEP